MKKILLIWTIFIVGYSFAGKIPPWVFGVRIATVDDYDVYNWQEGIKKAVQDGANVILDWDDISNWWWCLYDPCLSNSIENIRRKSNFVHDNFPGVKIIFYVAPLEFVTYELDENGDGRIDVGKEKRSLSLSHPQWAQVGISGKKAVFFGSFPQMPFWVCPSCEDVWLTPANEEFRGLVMNQMEKLAVSGADGIWLDVPFMQSDYGPAWINQWADVSSYARDLFKRETGYEIPSPPFSPDWSSEAWLKFVQWRYKFVRDFIGEIREKIKNLNKDFLLSIETAVDYTAQCTHTASDPKDMAQVADLVAHEVGGVEEGGQKYVWFFFISKLLAWKSIDSILQKPSWSLSYSFSDLEDAYNNALLHGETILLSGFSYYTSGNETMSGIADPNARRIIYRWARENRDFLYSTNLFPYSQVGLILSRRTLDYRVRGFWERDEYSDGFYGMGMLLLTSHIPYVVIHQDFLPWINIENFPLIVLPNYEAMSDDEALRIEKYVERGGEVISTGFTSLYDEYGSRRDSFALKEVFGFSQPLDGIHLHSLGKGLSVYSSIPWGKYFFWSVAPWDPQGNDADFEGAESLRIGFVNKIMSLIHLHIPFKIHAPSSVVVLPFCSTSGLQLRLINLTGVEKGKAEPDETEVKISLPYRPVSVIWIPFPLKQRFIPPSSTVAVNVKWGGILILKGYFPENCEINFPFFKKYK